MNGGIVPIRPDSPVARHWSRPTAALASSWARRAAYRSQAPGAFPAGHIKGLPGGSEAVTRRAERGHGGEGGDTRILGLGPACAAAQASCRLASRRARARTAMPAGEWKGGSG